MPLLSRLIDFETLEQCVRKLLNGKATGVDGIPRAFYKYGPQGLLELLWAALNAYRRGKTSLFVPMNGLDRLKAIFQRSCLRS